MAVQIGHPDPAPPLVRRLAYFAFCWMNRHPSVWRAIGALCRLWPFVGNAFGFAARHSAVWQVLHRPDSFSSTSHGPNLIASEFMIGMDPGPVYQQDWKVFQSLLGMLNVKNDSDAEARARLARIEAAGPDAVFDLVEDYLMWIVFAAIRPGFGNAADAVIAGAPGLPVDEALTRHYLHDIRYVAAHLFAGRLAPLDIQRRAEIRADSLRSRIDRSLPLLRAAWPQTAGLDDEAIRRTAIGFGWVSHPVTVQSAALVVQELLARPAVYAGLLGQARALGDACWSSEPLRNTVRSHVLELMRFRPVFPLLARDVPRNTEFESGGQHNAICPAGSSVTVLSISALFDPRGKPDAGRYCPHRNWGQQAPSQFLMFGLGSRQCPAKDHAVEMMTSAVIGLLQLPRLKLAGRIGQRIVYDGPLICRMGLRRAH